MVARVAPDFDLEKKYSINPAISELEYDENRLEKVFLGSAEVDCKDLLGKNYRIDVCAPIMSGAIMKVSSNSLYFLRDVCAGKIFFKRFLGRNVITQCELFDQYLQGESD